MKEQGKCPYCGSENIKYGSSELKDGEVYDYYCHCDACGKDFIEGYHLEYDGMFDENGQDIPEEEK
jgi:hypothetical protein